LRIAAAWLAGINRMPWHIFLFWNALGGIAWATSIGLRSADADLIRQHWPGPQPPSNSILRLAKGRARRAGSAATAPARTSATL